ncbi:MAG TPA: serine hydrolase domain-containing protein [Lysobacter sp.]
MTATGRKQRPRVARAMPCAITRCLLDSGSRLALTGEIMTRFIAGTMRRISRPLAVGVLISVTSLSSLAAVEQPLPAPDAIALAELDGFALGLEEANQFSGVVLVARDGHVLFEKAYGKTDEKVEEKSDAPVTLDTRFNLASAGKMFTATAILQQIAMGRLTLDTTVGEVLKDYPNKAFATTVTVRHLLTHTGGAGDIDLFGTEHADNRERVHSVADMVALHGNRAPAFVPGSNQEYGNFGHVVLGRMVEVLSGEDFESYIRRHVFEPAGMTHTGFVDCTERAPDIAIGYATVGDRHVPNCITQPTRGFPAGGELSTAGDMYRFVMALQAGKLIPAALFADAVKSHYEFMGLGFFATGYGPGVPEHEFRWGHGGSSDGACVDVRTYPKTGETIIVLSNKDMPGGFSIANFLHKQWSRKARASKS